MIGVAITIGCVVLGIGLGLGLCFFPVVVVAVDGLFELVDHLWSMTFRRN